MKFRRSTTRASGKDKMQAHFVRSPSTSALNFSPNSLAGSCRIPAFCRVVTGTPRETQLATSDSHETCEPGRKLCADKMPSAHRARQQKKAPVGPARVPTGASGNGIVASQAAHDRCRRRYRRRREGGVHRVLPTTLPGLNRAIFPRWAGGRQTPAASCSTSNLFFYQLLETIGCDGCGSGEALEAAAVVESE